MLTQKLKRYMEKVKEEIKDDNRICRALIEPQPEGADFDFVAVAVPAENGQINYNWRDDEYYNQVLRTAPENINTSRLDSGLPLFDNHVYDKSALNTLGITAGYEFTERGLEVKCKFGNRADVALRNDVKEGIVKTVSIEGSIQKYEVERKAGELPIYYATLWTPESLSFAPVPNDIGAQIDVQRKIKKQIEVKTEEKADNYKTLINKF